MYNDRSFTENLENFIRIVTCTTPPHYTTSITPPRMKLYARHMQACAAVPHPPPAARPHEVRWRAGPSCLPWPAVR
eukprot:2672835-Prymnesium_polylepis.1